jgi:glycerol-3-phosphate dehydrogenase (NAD(P)+)
MEEIGVVGEGVRAQALARLVELAGKRAVSWDGSEEGSAREFTSRARLIFITTPIWDLRGVSYRLGAHLSGYHRLVHAAEGMEGGERASVVLQDETPARQLGALVGSLQAEEGQPSALVVGSLFPSVLGQVQDALASPQCRVYSNTDLVGIEVAASVAGVLAVAVGIFDGLALGPGARGLLMARGVAEIGRIVVSLGGLEKTGAGMAGLGVLTSACTGEGSEGYKLGRALVEGVSLERLELERGREVGGIIRTCAWLANHTHSKGVKAHLVDALWQIFSGQASVQEAVHRIFALKQASE